MPRKRNVIWSAESSKRVQAVVKYLVAEWGEREADNSNAVANLLNLTDGFPADVLNLNIICTYNKKTDDIDPALPERGA